MWNIRALAAAGLLARIATAADFDWTAIEPSEQLKYHPCYDGYRCARLSVPYDCPRLPETHAVYAPVLTMDHLQPRLAGRQ